MKYYYCQNCGNVFPEEDCGHKTEAAFDYEYGSERGTHYATYECCPECGSIDDLEEANYCPCGVGIKPTEKLCENCEDSLRDIKNEVRALFPNIKPIDETTVEEYLVDNLFPRLTPMQFIDGGWEL